ncbi:MAG: FMN-binding protein [Fusobacteriaceae bacterium]
MKKIMILAILTLSTLTFSKTIKKEGVAFAFKGDMKVEVELEGKKILGIKVLSHEDTPKYADPAIEEITEEILKKQSTEGIDDVAGATYTSRGLKEAVQNALDKK